MKRVTKGSAYHHGDLKSALMTSAGKLLERDGPEAISLRAVARGIGVSQTAPYNHFPDKEHLLAALAAGGFRQLEEAQITAAQSAREAHKKIVAIGCAYVDFARKHTQLYRLMFGAGIADWRAHPEVEQAKQATYAPVKQALAGLLGADASIGAESVAAWALVHGLSMLLIDGALSSDEESLVEKAISRFVLGLR